MARELLNNDSKLNIYSSFSLSNDDVATMSLLYAPLLGSDAFLLYMALNSLLERNNLKSEELKHSDLLELFSLKANDFMKARYKLEALGLLLTYKSESDSYIYILCPPCTAKNFIKDATLGLYLYSKLNPDLFNFIYRHFVIEKIDKSGYQNVTKAFDEVFESNTYNSEAYEKFEYILGRNINESLVIKDYKFDIDLMLKKIDKKLFEYGINNDLKNKISKLAYVYGYTEVEMESLFNDSINKFGYFDYNILRKKANILLRFKRNLSAPKLTSKIDNELKNNDMVSYLENVSPSVLLDEMIPNYDPKYLDIINQIYQEIDLPRGVLNCMIIKVVKNKGGDLPSVAYFKKVAESWVSDNILSTDDAIKYVTTAKEKKEDTNSFSDVKNEGKDFEEL